MAVTHRRFTVDDKWVDRLDRLAGRIGWTKVETFRVAIRTLERVMDKHDDATRFADDDIRELYARIARELPTDLLEVAQSVEFLRYGEVPAVKAQGWVLWADEGSGELFAREEGGERRLGRVGDGRIQVWEMPPKHAALS